MSRNFYELKDIDDNIYFINMNSITFVEVSIYKKEYYSVTINLIDGMCTVFLDTNQLLSFKNELNI